MKQKYTIAKNGIESNLMLSGHRQHIWNESTATVSHAVKNRIRRELGDGPYENPYGHFGQAQIVHLVTQ